MDGSDSGWTELTGGLDDRVEAHQRRLERRPEPLGALGFDSRQLALRNAAARPDPCLAFGGTGRAAAAARRRLREDLHSLLLGQPADRVAGRAAALRPPGLVDVRIPARP